MKELLRDTFSSLVYASIAISLVACGGSSAPPDTPKPIPIVTNKIVLNFSSNETIRYSLPILHGRCAPEIKNVKIETAGNTYLLETVDGYFKGAIPMRTGDNEISISAGTQISKINIRYLPADNPKKVQTVYALAVDDDGHFFSERGSKNDLAEAQARLALEALMMQSATAEMLYKGRKQRITYALAEDANGQPSISILRLPQLRVELHQKTEQELYQIIDNALHSAGVDENVKRIVTTAFSSYENEKIVGHLALGGGNLAIFGALHLYACPRSLDQIATHFSNASKINTQLLPDDSGGRGTYWAQCATGMGASLHELGHAFDLPHTPTGIMARGFDNFNRLFVMREPGEIKALTPENEDGAIWDPSSIDILLKSEWFKK